MAQIIWPTKAEEVFSGYKRFRLIYHYDEENDAVHIMDIWDAKSNLVSLPLFFNISSH
jgi:hypothetical protein